MNHALRFTLLVGLLTGCSATPPPGTDGNGTMGAPATNGGPGGAPPLGKSVLIFWGEGGIPPGFSYYLIGSINDLLSTLSSIPVAVTQTDQWPADLSQYRLVLWYAPGASKPAGFTVSSDRVNALTAYLHAGGRVVVAGDIGGGLGDYNLTNADLTIDALMGSLGVNLRIADPAAVASPAPCPGAAADPLLTNVDKIAWDAVHSLGVGAPGTWMLCQGLAIQTVGCGELILIGDTQPVSDFAGGNPQFIVNLATVPSRSACH